MDKRSAIRWKTPVEARIASSFSGEASSAALASSTSLGYSRTKRQYISDLPSWLVGSMLALSRVARMFLLQISSLGSCKESAAVLGRLALRSCFLIVKIGLPESASLLPSLSLRMFTDAGRLHEVLRDISIWSGGFSPLSKSVSIGWEGRKVR